MTRLASRAARHAAQAEQRQAADRLDIRSIEAELARGAAKYDARFRGLSARCDELAAAVGEFVEAVKRAPRRKRAQISGRTA